MRGWRRWVALVSVAAAALGRAGPAAAGGAGDEAGAWVLHHLERPLAVMGTGPPGPAVWFTDARRRAVLWLRVPPAWTDAAAAQAGFDGFVDERGRKVAELLPGVFVFPEGRTCADYAGYPGHYTLATVEVAPFGPPERPGFRELEVIFDDPKHGGQGAKYAYTYCAADGGLALWLTFYVARDEWSPESAGLLDEIVATARFGELQVELD
jgi:hypothetical protein